MERPGLMPHPLVKEVRRMLVFAPVASAIVPPAGL
jgi:hypothetical protein